MCAHVKDLIWDGAAFHTFKSVCLYRYKRTTHKVNPAQLGRTNKMCVSLTVGAGMGPDQ